MAQKLYTEEQVRQAFIAGCDFVWDDKEEYTKGINEIVDRLTPIALLTDEEIEKMLGSNVHDYYKGAKWMRDKILNK